MSELTSEDFQREMYARSLDTIRVHNPTDKDVILNYDRMGTKKQRVEIPHARRDIGKGKGNQDLPRYLAEIFTKQIVEQLITAKSEKEWNKIKQNYRIDERPQYEERYAIRTNNPGEWKEIMPKVWLGVVSKYGGEALPDPAEKPEPKTRDIMTDMAKELDLENKEFHEEEVSQNL